MSNIISVCIPTYNGEKYLRQCLASVIGQSYAALEILVVDDGSSDNSLAIAQEFAALDDRVKIHQNPVNLGLVKNWHRCIELATGDWIKFLFQDDLMHAQCVEKMLAACLHYSTPVCVCAREFLIEDSASYTLKKFFTEEVYKLESTYSDSTYIKPQEVAGLAAANLFTNFIGEPIALLFRKNLIQLYGNYNQDLVQLVDYEFALRLGLSLGFCFLPEKLVSFRVHSSSESSNQNSNALKQLKNQFLEPLLMYHEYAFNPYFKLLRQSYNVTTGKLLKDALYFYKYHHKNFSIPRDTKTYLFKKYRRLNLIALGRFIPK